MHWDTPVSRVPRTSLSALLRSDIQLADRDVRGTANLEEALQLAEKALLEEDL